MLQHPDGLCHPERSEGSVNVSKATVLTYSDSSSYRPQNDIDSIEKLLAKVALVIKVSQVPPLCSSILTVSVILNAVKDL